jgi:hypothetical protein
VTETARGNRRIDHILSSGFAEGLGDIDDAELRRRRDMARAEREYLSILRRMVQGRLEILRAERERRAGRGEAGAVVDRLPDILSEGTRGSSRGEAPVVSASADELAVARRRVERLVSDSHLSNLQELSDDDLEEALGKLKLEERSVSDSRAEVLGIYDALQGEVKRRLRAELGPASQA